MNDHLNTPTEILTLEEARSRLEVLKPTIKRLADVTAKLTELMDEANPTDPQVLETELTSARTAFQRLLKRLNEQGVYVKDPSIGLIDFYSWRGDEMVFLCHVMGEPTIDYWHPIDAGFTGRRPVSEL